MKLKLLIALFLINHSIRAQEFTIPDVVNSQNYWDYSNNVLEAIQWLKNNQLNHEKRNEVELFIKKWTNTNPDISVEISDYLMPYIDQNPHFLMLFYAGWVEYSLQNQSEFNRLEANVKGMRTILDYYNSDKIVTWDMDLYDIRKKKDKKLSKIIKKKLD